MMEETFVKVEEITDSLKEYVDIRVEDAKLRLAEKSSGLVANLIARIVVIVAFSLALVFLSIALAIGLANWWGQMWLGFLVVGGIYIFLGWLVWALRESLIHIPMMNNILSHLTKKDEDDD
jgi:ABC-type uncharacterized transport system fused permease/ATPase subunit